MSYKICFSIPCHEQPKCVISMCKNINHLAPNSAVVLHANKNSGKEFYNELIKISQEFDNVFINDNQVAVEWGNGMLLNAFLSNYKFAKNNIDFEYYWLDTSNSLVVNPYIENVVDNYDYGIGLFEQTPSTDWCWTPFIINDSQLIKLANKCNNNNPLLFGGPIEGAFFKKDLFDQIFLYLEEFLELPPGPYPREETFIHTAVGNLTDIFHDKRKGFNLCLRNFSHEVLTMIENKNFDYLTQHNIMTMKPFPRNEAHPLREFIRLMEKSGGMTINA